MNPDIKDSLITGFDQFPASSHCSCMTDNADLNAAKAAKSDEFYTQADDIEAEMEWHRKRFSGKAIHCSCDDPEHSEFYRHFKENFEAYGLRKLTATGFSAHSDCPESVGAEYDGERETSLDLWNADFASSESIDIMHDSDMVITNPPFSLFREFTRHVADSGREFCILGNMNAMSASDVFPMFKDGRMWYGPTMLGVRCWFGIPDRYPASVQDSDRRINEDGRTEIRIPGITRWFTNMDHPKRHEPFELKCMHEGNEQDYPKYDNFDAIEVDKSSRIPMDYDGVMGVPITFMDKYCPEQFEILDMLSQPILNGEKLYKRILIRRI